MLRRRDAAPLRAASPARGLAQRRDQRVRVRRVDEHARLGRDELRVDRRGSSRRRSAPSPSPPATPGRTPRSATAGRSRRRARSRRGRRRAGRGPAGSTFARPSSAGRSGPSPRNVRRPSPRRAKASASAITFLRSVSDPMQRKCGAGSSPRGRGLKASRSTPQSMTASGARGIRAASQRELAISASAQRRTGAVAARSGGRSRFATSCPCAITTSGAPARRAPMSAPRPGREEHVREDDVRSRAARGADRVDGQPQMSPRPAGATRDRDQLHVVTEPLQLADDRHEERPEVRVVGSGPHRGDEEDAHARRTVGGGAVWRTSGPSAAARR